MCEQALVIAANLDAKPVFYSDRRYHYMSMMFQRKLREKQMMPSISRVGHCIDNCLTERFCDIIKSEMYQMYEIINETSLKHAIKDYIGFYS